MPAIIKRFDGDSLVAGATLRRWDGADWVPAIIPPFDAANYGPIALLLDAATMSPGEGGAVPSWTDTGPDGRHATINGFFTPPTWHASGVNGQAYVKCRVASNQGLRAFPTVHTTYTAFIIARQTIAGAGGRLVGAVFPEGDNFLTGWHGGRENVLYNGSFIEPFAQSTTVAWKHYVARGGGGETSFWSGDTFQGTNGGGGGWGNSLAIGGYALAGAAELSDAEISYILIYRAKLADPDRLAVKAALTARFAV